jgi:hypothetical protein
MNFWEILYEQCLEAERQRAARRHEQLVKWLFTRNAKRRS